jgi:hypothetical protein
MKVREWINSSRQLKLGGDFARLGMFRGYLLFFFLRVCVFGIWFVGINLAFCWVDDLDVDGAILFLCLCISVIENTIVRNKLIVTKDGTEQKI